MTDTTISLDQAFALIDTGNLAEADAICAKVHAADPQNHAAVYLRGLIAYQ